MHNDGHAVQAPERPTDKMPFAIRRSETAEQHAFESQIHAEQFNTDSSTRHVNAAASHGKINGLSHSLKSQIRTSCPEAVQDLKIMKSISALETRVKKDMSSATLFPEISKTASVRRGLELCSEELAFLTKRKCVVRDAFANYFHLDPADVHVDDVPTISFGGSGGGFRATIACLAYSEALERAGLWDCLTYVVGVSGSCWSLAAYYTFGQASMQKVIEHCKRRFSPHHPLSGEAIRTLLSTPDGAKTTLSPSIQKKVAGLHTVAMDLYAVFTTGWIFLQDDPASHLGGRGEKEVAGYQRSWYRYSSAREYVDSGAEPLPIMTAIRHERPWKDWVDKEHPFKEPNHSTGDHNDSSAWFQWFEMTPYEIGCDEVEAWVPTWAFGRPFNRGTSTLQLPEQSLALLLGLCTSAPAGPLTSYIATISRNLPKGFLGNSIHGLAHGVTKLWGKQGTEEFQNHHPLHACNEHNFLYKYSAGSKMDGEYATHAIENAPRLHLIDSGMDNNCPTYVFLHPSRQADVILNMDASSDVQKDTFPDRVNQIGRRKGVQFTRRHDIKPGPDPSDANRYSGLYAQVYDSVSVPRSETVVDSYGKTVPTPPAPVYPAGNGEVTMIYLPLLPNENAVKNFDPGTTKWSGSYNLVWTAEQVQILVDVCMANFAEAEQTVKESLWEAYSRKKRRREAAMNAQSS